MAESAPHGASDEGRPRAPTRLVIATHNRGKVAEISELLADGPWDCRGLPHGAPEFPETGTTFAENARGKALFYADLTGELALADDSGIEIEALGGEPGVYSARYIDPALAQPERNRRVLERMRDVPTARRGARFVCHAVLAVPSEVLFEHEGTVAGTIATAPHGDGGFGYDPIFVPTELDGRTFAEIDSVEKSSISHRGQAVRAVIAYLEATVRSRGDGVS